MGELGFIEKFMAKTGLKWVGKKTDGYKTKGTGVGLYALGLLYFLPLLWPDVSNITGIEGNLEYGIYCFIGGTGALGGGGKAEKIMRAIKEGKVVIKRGK